MKSLFHRTVTQLALETQSRLVMNRNIRRSRALNYAELQTFDLPMTSVEDKTIPFLRRLRDMLVENEDAVTFIPGTHNRDGRKVLGRIVVHDRVVVEESVLPKYFNHSSFASLRRQLNYFSFVRMGKGRQRESVYINANVVDLEDLMRLKRRPSGAPPPSVDEVLSLVHVTVDSMDDLSSIQRKPVVARKAPRKSKHQPYRCTKDTLLSLARFNSPVARNYADSNNVISEDEGSATDCGTVILDLTTTGDYSTLVDKVAADADLLAGCTALLGLSGKTWA